MSVIDFAYEVLEMQQRIDFLERELEHYKELHRMNCEILDRSDQHTKEMIAMTFDAMLDPDSIVNKGYAAIAAEQANTLTSEFTGLRGFLRRSGGMSSSAPLSRERNEMLLTKEHYDLMARFEANYKHKRLAREAEKTLWAKGHVYADGHVNELFLAYRNGYALGVISGEAAEKLAAAPVAIMDTRTALGICAPTEEDFPALYALQGHRVALIDMGPNVVFAPKRGRKMLSDVSGNMA